LPPPRDAETFGNPVHLVVHGPVDAPANLMSAMGRKRTHRGALHLGCRWVPTRLLSCLCWSRYELDHVKL
jgi:hypothetical protein